MVSSPCKSRASDDGRHQFGPRIYAGAKSFDNRPDIKRKGETTSVRIGHSQ